MRALVTDFSAPKLVLTSLLGRVDKRLFFGPHSTFALKDLPDPELPAPDW
ncbi:MAG: alcohol dehydrogenase, partial [Deltaproteobacteria bacterium]